MKIHFTIPMLSLQVFAEGGAAAGAGAGDGGTAQGQGVTGAAALPQTKGVKSNPLADVKYGIQEEEAAPDAGVQTQTAEQPPDPEAEFEKLIKGQYKQQYDARVQDTIRKRLSGTKETVDKFNALQPTLEMLAKKYGVDASDVSALTKAIEEDDAYYQEEALAKGLTVPQLKELKKMERENEGLRRQMQEQQRQENAGRLYASWMNQAEEARKVYPSFDLRAEMENPKFMDLLRSNIDVRTAYEVLHKDEIIPAAMQFTAKTVEAKLAKKIAAGGTRPAENAIGSGAAAVVKSDVSQLSRADRQEIIRRVQRGERIRF
ncbi:MAG: hypothetical protein ACI3V5_10415 [Faecousia sp.]